MNIKYLLIRDNSFVFEVKESGTYSVCLLHQGKIVEERAGWIIKKGSVCFIGPPPNLDIKDIEINFNRFGLLGNFSHVPLKFIHNPRSAGTSLENWGFFHGFKWGRVDRDFLKEHGLGWHFTWDETHTDPYLGFKKFAVVRNPFKACVSRIYYEGILKYPKTSEEFNLTIRREEGGLQLPDEFIHPQHKFVYKGEKKMVDHVLRFENLKEDFESIINEYGIDREFDLRQNASHKPNPHFTVKDLDQESIDFIRRFYEKDFTLFNYSMDPSDS